MLLADPHSHSLAFRLYTRLRNQATGRIETADSGGFQRAINGGSDRQDYQIQAGDIGNHFAKSSLLDASMLHKELNRRKKKKRTEQLFV
ncbi:MAG: hypothetical protein EBZ36_01550 [Acidobacteria bacterium]|nr:hypothetical protein [Acidobacteriota bacterium]